jgi:hypothetical protein
MVHAIARRLRAASIVLGGTVIAASMVVPVQAASPEIVTVQLHRNFPFVSCGTSWIWGTWDVTRRVTTFFDASGAATSDIYDVRFSGVVYNPANGASTPDAGVNDFHDQLAPDGSFASTMWTFQRTNAYVHEAGQRLLGPSDANGDQATLRQVGNQGFNDTTIAELCTALGAD